jgi:thiol:disulfide interchange protein DsbD
LQFFGTLAFYLFGKITLPHDSPLTHIRRTFNVWVASANIHDIFNSDCGSTVKIISAFPPTMEYSESLTV